MRRPFIANDTLYTRILRTALLLCCLFAPATASAQDTAEEPMWYAPLFAEASTQLHFPGWPLSGVVNPFFGFRLAAGYEWKKFRPALSFGYSYAGGADPFVESISFEPLTLRLGYVYLLAHNWGIRADMGFGIQFSQTSHYETWSVMQSGGQSRTSKNKPLAEARLYGTYTLPPQTVHLELFTGGGVDMVFESDAPIVLPVIELGVTVKPFASKRRRIYVPEPELEPEPEPVFVPEPEPEPDPEDVVLVPVYGIFFEADSGVAIVNSSLPALREAGELLRTESEMRVTLRGYAAPAGTVEGQFAVSAARVWTCVEILMSEYGIGEERIRMRFYGADETPQAGNEDWEYRRRVDLTLEAESKAGAEPDIYIGIEDANRRNVQFHESVFFEAESGSKILESSLPALREAGRLLRTDSEARIILRGHAAPFGTDEGQITVSAARVWFCVEFLKREYGIAEERMRKRYYGAEEISQQGSGEWGALRRVELIIE